jgi:PAS domain-containing protein
MTDKQKTKRESIEELDVLRQRVAALEQSELARKKAEEALRQNEEKCRAVFENTGAATVVLEENSIISVANAEFVRLSGYSPGEIEGKRAGPSLWFKRTWNGCRLSTGCAGRTLKKRSGAMSSGLSAEMGISGTSPSPSI